MLYRVYSDLDAVTARMYSCWNCGATKVAPTEKDRPLPRRRRGPIFKHVHVKERMKILVMDLEESDARNDCAGEGVGSNVYYWPTYPLTGPNLRLLWDSRPLAEAWEAEESPLLEAVA
jgi:hypothetical protein